MPAIVPSPAWTPSGAPWGRSPCTPILPDSAGMADNPVARSRDRSRSPQLTRFDIIEPAHSVAMLRLLTRVCIFFRNIVQFLRCVMAIRADSTRSSLIALRKSIAVVQGLRDRKRLFAQLIFSLTAK